MRLSELIAQLSEVQAKVGDVEVLVEGCVEFYRDNPDPDADFLLRDEANFQKSIDSITVEASHVRILLGPDQ